MSEASSELVGGKAPGVLKAGGGGKVELGWFELADRWPALSDVWSMPGSRSGDSRTLAVVRDECEDGGLVAAAGDGLGEADVTAEMLLPRFASEPREPVLLLHRPPRL